MALFTLQELKDHLGISSTSHDTFLTQLVTRASLMVARWCNRIAQDGTSALELNTVDATEHYDGSGLPDLRVKRYPITVVTTVHVDADRDFGAETLIDSTDYVTDRHGFIRWLPQEQTGFTTISYWPTGVQNVKVVYRGGYDVSSSTANVPADLKEGAILWAASMFARRASVGVVAESIGSYSVTYQGGVAGAGIPIEAKQLLTPFRDFSGVVG